MSLFSRLDWHSRLCVIASFFFLPIAQVILWLGGFRTARRMINLFALRSEQATPELVERGRLIIQLSERFLRYQVIEPRCLLRAVVLTCVLRWALVPGELVIGVQPVPFAAHAWVEVAGHVVGSFGDTSFYQEIDRV